MAYNPDQPRDERGRFASGGNNGASGKELRSGRGVGYRTGDGKVFNAHAESSHNYQEALRHTHDVYARTGNIISVERHASRARTTAALRRGIKRGANYSE